MLKKIFHSLWLNFGIFSKILLKLYNFVPDDFFKILSVTRLTLKSRILDVGCGAGNYLYVLKEIGYKNLLGIDPYLEHNIKYQNGLIIKKKKSLKLMANGIK
ncbi:MAG: hypothetical protein ACTSRH_05160 [Promethearchaeota archaeon]